MIVRRGRRAAGVVAAAGAPLNASGVETAKSDCLENSAGSRSFSMSFSNGDSLGHVAGAVS